MHIYFISEPVYSREAANYPKAGNKQVLASVPGVVHKITEAPDHCQVPGSPLLILESCKCRCKILLCLCFFVKLVSCPQ